MYAKSARAKVVAVVDAAPLVADEAQQVVDAALLLAEAQQVVATAV